MKKSVRTLALALLATFSAKAETPQSYEAIVINELMASNAGTVMSPAFNFDSWIEFYNPTGQAISLAGMFLSNDVDYLKRWQMPDDIGTIPARGFLVVWLGSDDILSNQAPFKLDCDGGVICLSDKNGTLITKETYPEALSRTAYARTTDGGNEWSWTAYPTPGTTNTTSKFATKRLAAPVVSQGSQLFTGTLNVSVDIPKSATLMYTTDGSMPMTATEASAGDEQNPTWNDWIKNGNCEGRNDECFLCRDGDGSGDIHRITDGAGVNGSRGLKVHAIDNPENDWDTQFFIYTPTHIWQSGEPYRFRMMVRADKPGYIFAQSHRTPGDYIYWEMIGGGYNIGTEWQEIVYEGTITDDQAGDGRMQTIAFNLNVDKVENNFYFDNISWESFGDAVSTDEVTARISKDGQFTVNGTTNYIFRLFQDGYLPSVPVTRSYIKTDDTYTIPVVSIVGDERYFTDPMWGIDIKGQNGIPGNADDDEPKNWNQPWDRPVNFSYISPTDGMLFNQDVNISVAGGWTRSSSPRSMKLKSNKVFDGQNRFDYSFFPQKPYIRNKTLLVRNGGNDIYDHHARFMDPALTTIIMRSGIDLDVQSFVQVVEYINGKRRGVLNLREPNNDKFVYANFGYDDDEIDMFENKKFKNGADTAYRRLCQLGERVNENGVYEEIKTLLDIDEFTNYMATELFLGNDDWPNNNVKGYRSQHKGRFRFVCFDLDYSFNPWGHRLESSLNDNKNVDMVKLFLDLLKHDGYRKKFIDTFCIVAGSVFERERATAIVDELADAMRPMSEYDGYLPDKSANKIKTQLQTRVDNLTSQLQQYAPMQLSGVRKQSVQLSADTEGATLLLNGMKIPYATFDGRLFPPVTLTAKAPTGYTFTGWKKSSASLVSLMDFTDSWKYFDKGEAAIGWQTADFDDSAWASGKAPLGYAMSGVTTTVGYGSDASQKHPTTYFRKRITLSSAPKDMFVLNYEVDDGFVVYVNGTEAGRVNMRQGDVQFNSFSQTYAESTPLTGSIELSPSLFHSGTNVIAVEVHNTSYTSSDLYWAANLQTTISNSPEEIVSTDPVIDLPDDSKLSLVATFAPITKAELAAQGITPVRINEVSANDGIYVTEYFKRNDWVELYNTTDQPIDVEGMYLTDNPEKPKKYQISKESTQANTVIPAHGYLIVWCDKKDPTLTQLHATFNIDAEGDELQLMAADGSWTDTFRYPAHNSDQTVGRYPDGSADVYVMNVPTIAKANIMSSYAVPVEQPTPTGISEVMAQQQVGSDVIYNLKGQVVKGALSPGIYIKNGRKFIVK